MIAIIDYGAGNVQSVYKAMRFIGCECKITKNPEEILSSDGAILPGQGSFGDCMQTMQQYNIMETVEQFIASGKPFLGICVGLQLLFSASEESPGVKGLEVFPSKIKRIPNGDGLKIPHMGWNSLDIIEDNGLFKGIENGSYVYFVHSYYLDSEDKSIVTAQTEYGVKIDAAVNRDNVYATQFHPEKSGDVGLNILRNFAGICGGAENVR
jgi:glutamine amidotransferase